MKTVSMIILTVAMASAIERNSKVNSDLKKNGKRGAGFFGTPTYDGFGTAPAFEAAPAFGASGWAPSGSANLGWDISGISDIALGQIQQQATHNIALQALRSSGTPSIAYPPEVVQAVQQAKDASHNVFLAQQNVDAAKQTAVIQQRIALAKEAAAREAAHRSEEISAGAMAEARASARQLVASQQRLATLKNAVAAAQRVAAAREAAAAAAIQRIASETAAELRKQDVEKQISQSEAEAKEKDIIAAKENAIANALQHTANAKSPSSYHPWG